MSDYDFLEFRQLKYFKAIAQAQRFTAAANNLNLSQSSLSHQVKQFEEYYEIQLFLRDHDGYSGLTDVGQIVISAAEELLRQRQDLVDIIKAFKDGVPASLKIGFSSLVEKKMLVSILEIARDLCPHCEILTEVDRIEVLESRVRDGDIDGALVTLPLTDCADLSSCLIEKDSLVVCMRADDPLAEHEAIPAHELNGKLALFEYPEVHRQAHLRLLQMLAGIGIEPKQCRPTQNRDHIQFLIQQQTCYAFVRGGRPLPSGLTTRPIHGVHWTIDTALIARPTLPHPALALLMRELRRKFSNLNLKHDVPKQTNLSSKKRSPKRQTPTSLPLFKAG